MQSFFAALCHESDQAGEVEVPDVDAKTDDEGRGEGGGGGSTHHAAERAGLYIRTYALVVNGVPTE